MRPTISEFSYGFAFTRELVESQEEGLTVAPVFPTLVQEGQPGGGFDVEIDRRGCPFFVQFKVCDRMVSRAAKEASYRLGVPCYRMRLRSTHRFRQHRMLLELESNGADVYYAAPLFDRPEELNDAFVRRQVCSRSKWIVPSDIGVLPDEREHYVSFDLQGGHMTVFSDTWEVEAHREFRDVVEGLRAKLRSQGEFALQDEHIERLVETIQQVQGLPDPSRTRALSVERRVEKETPLQRLAYYASVFIGAGLFVVQER